GAGALVDGDHLAEDLGVVDHDVVAEQHDERVVADVAAGLGDGVAEPERLALADVVDLGEVGEAADLLELGLLALVGELLLELDAAVEVVLEAALVAPGDDEDVVDAGPHRLLHDVLDGRLVDDRQHLLGLRLGGGQEAGAETGSGDDGLAYGGHGARLPTPGGAFAPPEPGLLALPEAAQVVAVAHDHEEPAGREGGDLGGGSTD